MSPSVDGLPDAASGGAEIEDERIEGVSGYGDYPGAAGRADTSPFHGLEVCRVYADHEGTYGRVCFPFSVGVKREVEVDRLPYTGLLLPRLGSGRAWRERAAPRIASSCAPQGGVDQVGELAAVLQGPAEGWVGSTTRRAMASL